MFTIKEINALIEAVEEWEQGESNIGDMVFGALFGSIAKDDPEAKAKHEKMMEERKLAKEEEKMRRKKIAAGIRYKLYNMLEEAERNEIANLHQKEG